MVGESCSHFRKQCTVYAFLDYDEAEAPGILRRWFTPIHLGACSQHDNLALGID